MNKKTILLGSIFFLILSSFYSNILIAPEPNEITFRELNTNAGDPVVILYVNSTIYSSIQAEVLQFAQDITNQGYNVTILNWTNTDVNVLKVNISSYYAFGLEGVILIGELPCAIARYWDNPWGVFRTFPTDLFLMDLDGLWQDIIIPNGMYDVDHTYGNIEHTNGTGDWEPEIWLSRISPYSMGMPGINYIDELKSFFNRDHNYRLGNTPHKDKAMLYIDNDWSSYKDEWLSNFTAYTGANVDCFADDAATTSADYLSRIQTDVYDFVHILVHSWPQNHTFGPSGNGADGVLKYSDIWGKDLKPIIYNLYACFSNNFREINNTGTYYLFTGNTLAVIGSARSGGMDLYQRFYDNLTVNVTLGKAFQQWFHNPEIESLGKTELYYGMTIFGDPLLTIHMPETSTLDNGDETPPPPTIPGVDLFLIGIISVTAIAFVMIRNKKLILKK